MEPIEALDTIWFLGSRLLSRMDKRMQPECRVAFASICLPTARYFSEFRRISNIERQLNKCVQTSRRKRTDWSVV
jgi:hypothetical protein